MSHAYEVDIGDLPVGCRGVALRYRREGSLVWNDLPEVQAARFTVDLPEMDGAIECEARLVDRRGVTQPKGRPITLNPESEAVTDRDAPKDLTWPSPAIRYEQGILTIQPRVPIGESEDEYVFDVALGGTANEYEAVRLGTIEAGRDILANALPIATQYVHTRPIRRSDLKAGAWQATTVVAPATDPAMVKLEDDAGTAFSGWTFDALEGKTPLESPGGSGLRNKAMPPIWDTTDTTSIWGKTAGPPIWAKHDYFPKGTVTSPAFGPGVVHEFLPVLYPQLSSQTLDARPIWGRKNTYRYSLARRQEADRTADFLEMERRARVRGLVAWNSAQNTDREPMELPVQISLSQNGADYGAYEDLVQGRRYRAANYKVRVGIRSRHGTKRITLTKWQILRWVRNRKFEFRAPFAYPTTNGLVEYTFAPVPELAAVPIAEVSVEDASAADGTVFLCAVQSITKTAIKVYVRQVCHGNVSTSGGVATWTYPRAFLAAPDITLAAVDSGKKAYAGLSAAPGTSSATVFAADDTGAAFNGTVHAQAVGIPVVTDKYLHVVLAGY